MRKNVVFIRFQMTHNRNDATAIKVTAIFSRQHDSPNVQLGGRVDWRLVKRRQQLSDVADRLVVDCDDHVTGLDVCAGGGRVFVGLEDEDAVFDTIQRALRAQVFNLINDFWIQRDPAKAYNSDENTNEIISSAECLLT